MSNKQQATSNKQQATSNKNSLTNLFTALIAIILAVTLTACGGGGGGGGSFSKVQSGEMHNDGGAGGWGNGATTGPGLDSSSSDFSIGGSDNLLISQMAALDNVTNVRIELTINGVAQEPIIADTTTTKDVLPKITPEDTVTGTAYINLSDGTVRAAQLDATQTSTGKVLKFKVPYKYSCSNDNGTLASGTYYARDGIDLSAYTESSIVGWFCQQDTSMHKGSYVTGVRGDITLVAVPDLTYSYDLSRGGYVPVGSNTPQTGISSNPYLINFDGTDTNQENQLYINIANYTCDSNDLTMVCDKAGLFTITQQSNGYSFVVKLNPSITRTDSRLNDNAKLTVTDPATDTTKEIYVKVIIPPLGSKPAPDAVGDIVFSDGTASAYTETLTATQIAEAVAIIFDASNKKGLGLNIVTGKEWCINTASAYNVNTYATSLDDGKANTNQIAALSDYNETNYPAFWYCTSYSVQGFTSGWYFPAQNEVITLMTNRTAVETAFTSVLGMTSPFTVGNYGCFSSSQYTSNTTYACFIPWDSGIAGTGKISPNCSIIAVRVFN